MNFDLAIKTVNTLLKKEQPKTFSSSWIFDRTQIVYHFVRSNFRTENDHIDWDRFTYALKPEYSRRRMRKRKKKP